MCIFCRTFVRWKYKLFAVTAHNGCFKYNIIKLTNYIFVDALDPIEYILMYNVNGELITKTTDKSICLSHLPNGIYVLHIVTEREILKTKFIHL